MIQHSKIIEFSLINPFRSKDFNKRVFARTRKSILDNAGNALLLMHPLSTRKHLKTPQELSFNNFLQQKINQISYDQYIANLENHIKGNQSLPIFIFYRAEDRSLTFKWLKNNPTGNLFIAIKSESGDAVPIIPHSEDVPAWRIFAGQILSLGVSRLQIAGELAYQTGEDNEKENLGCVYYACDKLNEYLGPSNFMASPKPLFELSILNNLTYPNISVPKHSSK